MPVIWTPLSSPALQHQSDWGDVGISRQLEQRDHGLGETPCLEQHMGTQLQDHGLELKVTFQEAEP